MISASISEYLANMKMYMLTQSFPPGYFKNADSVADVEHSIKQALKFANAKWTPKELNTVCSHVWPFSELAPERSETREFDEGEELKRLKRDKDLTLFLCRRGPAPVRPREVKKR